MEAFLTNLPRADQKSQKAGSEMQETLKLPDPNDTGRETAANIKREENIKSKIDVEAKIALMIDRAIQELSQERCSFPTTTGSQLDSPVSKETSQIKSPLAGDEATIVVQKESNDNLEVPEQKYGGRASGEVDADGSSAGTSEDKESALFGGMKDIRPSALGISWNEQRPGQKYGGRTSGEVDTDGSSVAISEDEESSLLGGMKNIRPSALGIPRNEQRGAQQATPHLQALGIQPQQPLGLPPTTAPLLQAPLIQDMGKSAFLQGQPLQHSIYLSQLTNLAPLTPIPQALNGSSHSGGQRVSGPQSLGMLGPQPGIIPLPPSAMYMQGQMPFHSSFAGPYHQSAYNMNSQMQPFQFHGPPQSAVHPTNQPIYVTQNFYAYPPGPTTQRPGYFQPPQGPQSSLSCYRVGEANSGAPIVGNPSTGGPEVIDLEVNSVRQLSRQPKPPPLMSLRLGQQANEGDDESIQNVVKTTVRNKRQKRLTGLTEIVDSNTGKNIGDRVTLEPQNWSPEMIAEFANRIANSTIDDSKSDSLANDTQQQLVGRDTIKKDNKVSVLRTSTEKQQDSFSDKVKKDESKKPYQTDTIPIRASPAKYTDTDNEWSLLNKSGKKVYDREFLIKLRDKPNSKIRPMNLPDLEISLKNFAKNRYSMDLMQLKEFDQLERPHLVSGVSSMGQAGAHASKQGSQQDKPKNNKLAIIEDPLSVDKDNELQGTIKVWQPSRLKCGDTKEEDVTAEVLYKRLRGVLNKLMPQKFQKLFNQVKALRIDSQEKLEGVVDLIFKLRAVDQPCYMAMYARMCKKLAQTQENFGILVTTRCRMEFEKFVGENAETIKIKEIEVGADADLKNAREIQQRTTRIKFYDNIRFMGKLFEQKMLDANTMHECVRYLLKQVDDKSLECLCDLLGTVGRRLECKDKNLEPYFKRIGDMVDRKVPTEASSRVRFMLQDLIDLRMNKWVQRKSGGNIKTTDQNEMETDAEYSCSSNEASASNQLIRNEEEDADAPLTIEEKYKSELMLEESDSMEQIHKQLLSLMSEEKENSCDNICSWISVNVSERASEPEFIKALMTAILEVSIEPYDYTWKFKVDKFQNLQTLIHRYIDGNIKLSELQCLITIQEYIHQLNHPLRVLLEVLEKQILDSILSRDIFHTQKSNKDLTPLVGKSIIAMTALKSFFTSLKRTDDECTRYHKT